MNGRLDRTVARTAPGAAAVLAAAVAIGAAAAPGCAAEPGSAPAEETAAALAPAGSAHPIAARASTVAAAAPAGGTLAAPSRAQRVLFRVPWGSEPGALGVDGALEGARPGPLAFAFDPAGRLVVLDTINGRLARFERDGELHAVLALPAGLAEDLAVTPAGELLVLLYTGGDGAGGELYDVARLAPDGTLLAAWASMPPLPTGLFVEGDAVLVESRHGPLHRVASLSGGLLRPDEQLVPVAVGRPDRGHAGRYWEARKDGDAVRLRANDAAGAPVAKVRLETPGRLLSLFSLDTDAAGNVFAGLYLDERAVVAVVAPDGALLGAAAVEPIRWADARRFVAVSDDGTLVEMRADERGVAFVEHLWRGP